MANWRMTGELPLDELLEDEVMERVIRKAGLDRIELRRRLAELARRLGDRVSSTNSRECGARLC